MSTLSHHKKEDKENIFIPIDGKSIEDIKKELRSNLKTIKIINA